LGHEKKEGQGEFKLKTQNNAEEIASQVIQNITAHMQKYWMMLHHRTGGCSEQFIKYLSETP
jgi:hypothetical protein